MHTHRNDTCLLTECITRIGLSSFDNLIDRVECCLCQRPALSVSDWPAASCSLLGKGGHQIAMLGTVEEELLSSEWLGWGSEGNVDAGWCSVV